MLGQLPFEATINVITAGIIASFVGAVVVALVEAVVTVVIVILLRLATATPFTIITTTTCSCTKIQLFQSLVQLLERLQEDLQLCANSPPDPVHHLHRWVTKIRFFLRLCNYVF